MPDSIYIVKRYNEPDIRFLGQCIASARTTGKVDEANQFVAYSGVEGRWTELNLYMTKGGRYVCEQIGRTSFDKERDRYSACIAERIDQVIAFFGFGWLAKELYEKADIPIIEDIE